LTVDCRERGHRVQVVAIGADYRQRPARGLKRWGRELCGLMRLFIEACRARPRPDVVISFSSPPLLNIFAVLAAKWHRARTVHWALDLYPDLALALEELRAGFLARILCSLTQWAYRRTDTVVTLDPDMRAHLRRRWGVESEIIAPWPPILQETPVAIRRAGKPCWLYSGNLGRAHDWETMLEVQKRIEERDLEIELHIRGGGAAWTGAREWAQRHGLKRCVWSDYVPEDELLGSLLSADLLVVTQRPEAQGLLWPSKLAVLLKLPRPILSIAPTDGAMAQLIREHGGSAAFAPGSVEPIAEWVLDAVTKSRASADEKVFIYRPDYRDALAAWNAVIEGCKRS